MNTQERDILLGSLLGDGALYKRSERGYRFEIGTIKPRYINQLCGMLPSLTHRRVITQHRIAPRQSFSLLRVALGLKTTPDIVDEVRRWYDGFYGSETSKHHIPHWLEPSATVLYHMYIGDGTLSDRMQFDKRRNNKFRILRASIATDCFETEDIKIFFDKLAIPYCLCRDQRREHPNRHNRVVFNGRSARAFLQYIGPCKSPEYAYKWNIKDAEYGIQVYDKMKRNCLIEALRTISVGELDHDAMVQLAKSALSKA